MTAERRTMKSSEIINYSSVLLDLEASFSTMKFCIRGRACLSSLIGFVSSKWKVMLEFQMTKTKIERALPNTTTLPCLFLIRFSTVKGWSLGMTTNEYYQIVNLEERKVRRVRYLCVPKSKVRVTIRYLRDFRVTDDLYHRGDLFLYAISCEREKRTWITISL